MNVVNRIEKVRAHVMDVLCKNEIKDQVEHKLMLAQQVATVCASVAVRRGASVELAVIIGILHNMYYLRTGIKDLNAYNSEEDASIILEGLECLLEGEKLLIRQAIFRQNDLEETDEVLDEIIKDSIIISEFLSNEHGVVEFRRINRLKNILKEFGREDNFKIDFDRKTHNNQFKDKRIKLAETAKEIYSKGSTDNNEVLKYFLNSTEIDAYGWNSAFIYHCCIKAGFNLPIKYPFPINKKFLSMDVWESWAKLKENDFYYPMCKSSKRPLKGDIAIIEYKANNSLKYKLGIIIDHTEHKIEVIEGDVNKKNYVVKNQYNETFAIIRIPEYYRF